MTGEFSCRYRNIFASAVILFLILSDFGTNVFYSWGLIWNISIQITHSICILFIINKQSHFLNYSILTNDVHVWWRLCLLQTAHYTHIRINAIVELGGKYTFKGRLFLICHLYTWFWIYYCIRKKHTFNYKTWICVCHQSKMEKAM